MSIANFKLLEALLAENELDELLKKLTDSELETDEDDRQKAVKLAARLEKLQEETVKGTVTFEQISVEENRIRDAISTLLQSMKNPKTKEEKVKKKRAWILPAAVYSVLAVFLLWWLFQPMPSFRMEADLLVDRFSFKYLDGPTDFAQGELLQCRWQNYDEATFNADLAEFDADLDGSYEFKTEVSEPLVIKSNPDVPGSELTIGPLRLEKLTLEKGADITLSRPDEQTDLLRLTVQQKSTLQGNFVYKSPLTVQAEQFTTHGIPDLEPEYFQPVQFRLSPAAGTALEAGVSGFASASTIDLQMKEGLGVDQTNLIISGATFYKPVENVAISTILKGAVRLAEPDRPAFKTWEMAEGEILDIQADKLSLENLKISKEGITLRVSGNVAHLASGAQRMLRNPLRYEWWWANRRTLLIGLGVAFVGLAFFLPPKLRDRIFTVLKLLKGF